MLGDLLAGVVGALLEGVVGGLFGPDTTTWSERRRQRVAIAFLVTVAVLGVALVAVLLAVT